MASPGLDRTVSPEWDELFVRILDPKSGKLLREHVRQKRGGYRFQQQDVSSRRPYKVSQLLWRAERAGAQIGALCNHIYNQQGQLAVRRIQGVLSLAKKFGTVAYGRRLRRSSGDASSRISFRSSLS